MELHRGSFHLTDIVSKMSAHLILHLLFYHPVVIKSILLPYQVLWFLMSPNRRICEFEPSYRPFCTSILNPIICLENFYSLY